MQVKIKTRENLFQQIHQRQGMWDGDFSCVLERVKLCGVHVCKWVCVHEATHSCKDMCVSVYMPRVCASVIILHNYV